jgi:uncharacterized protein YoxC
MQNPLLIAALIVIAIWIVIMVVYLLTSRKQLSMEDTIESIERELDDIEKRAG